jgi:hypothetical protein
MTDDSLKEPRDQYPVSRDGAKKKELADEEAHAPKDNVAASDVSEQASAEAAIAALLGYAPHFERWARGRIPQAIRGAVDEHDLVQEAILHAVRRGDIQGLKASTLNAYLRRSILNKIRDYAREQSRLNESLDEIAGTGRRRQTSPSAEIEVEDDDLVEAPSEQDIILEQHNRALTRLAQEMNSPRRAFPKTLDHGNLHGDEASSLDQIMALDGAFKVWLADCKDLWLRDAVARRARKFDLWERVASWGMYVRLRHRSAKEAQQLVRRTIEGRVDEASSAPRQWARRLPKPMLETIEKLAMGRALELERELVRDDVSWNSAALIDHFLRLAHARDDLQSVDLLLSEAGQDAHLDAVLDSIDRHGRAFRFNLPIDLQFQDERLERVSLVDPTAWWGSLAFQVPAF